eukprot:NODE_525_length_2141_cov_123.910612_g483_i0.p1 GENE.NODE_525_length_2141_cov_123.910612_g483_i0~~NODE_525_length_2141_cov_123.910612_g483_i0.p1  ORF type:complete len:579 (-),score=123.32 NODE_525_length_2141_cov_123.910612_g483_i0:296-2032(-)
MWQRKPVVAGIVAGAFALGLLIGVVLFGSIGSSSSPTLSGGFSGEGDETARAGNRPVANGYTEWLIQMTSPWGLPLSYQVEPADYFKKIPENLRPEDVTEDKASPECGMKIVPKQTWDAYEFQTEQMLVSTGCAIYDAAVGSIALAASGLHDAAQEFFWEVLLPGHTGGIMSIRGTTPCKGIIAFGQCEEPRMDGACGLCYGDGIDGEWQTPPFHRAWFFRLIGDWWAYENTTNVLCPEMKRMWTWPDWKPTLGDNAWAALLGPAQVVWLRNEVLNPGHPERISRVSAELRLGLDFVESLKAMRAGDSGGIYFAPRNTYYGYMKADVGSHVSTENSASLLAGLKAFRHVLQKINHPQHKKALADIEELAAGLQRFLKGAYDPNVGYFRVGAQYDPRKKKLTWAPSDLFAVDCQSWVGSVLGSTQIDEWFGDGTAAKVWEKTKSIGGYGKQPNGMVKGVGYSENKEAQVFSGEWSYGAANWLKIMATESKYSASVKQRLAEEAEFIAKSIKDELGRSSMVRNRNVTGILYANKRYLIPPQLGGWYANSIPSRASTAWAALWDRGYNPLHLSGRHISTYE